MDLKYRFKNCTMCKYLYVPNMLNPLCTLLQEERGCPDVFYCSEFKRGKHQ